MNLLIFCTQTENVELAFFITKKKLWGIARPVLILLLGNSSRWFGVQHHRSSSFQTFGNFLNWSETAAQRCFSDLKKSHNMFVSITKRKFPHSNLILIPKRLAAIKLEVKKPKLRNSLQKAICVAGSLAPSFLALMIFWSFELTERRNCSCEFVYRSNICGFANSFCFAGFYWRYEENYKNFFQTQKYTSLAALSVYFFGTAMRNSWTKLLAKNCCKKFRWTKRFLKPKHSELRRFTYTFGIFASETFFQNRLDPRVPNKLSGRNFLQNVFNDLCSDKSHRADIHRRTFLKWSD